MFSSVSGSFQTKDRLPTNIRPQTGAATDGRGYTAWTTRRHNEVRQFAEALVRQTGSLDELRLVAHKLSERLADAKLGDTLPRGYRFCADRDGNRSLALNDELFAPSIRDPLPSKEAIKRLSNDLWSGWLSELGELRWDA